VSTTDAERIPQSLLGLSPAEHAAYETMIDHPAATLADLAVAWTRPEQLEQLLGSLEQRGLISVAAGPPARYSAISPNAAFGEVLRDHRERLAAARSHIAVLDAAYHGRAAGADASSIVEVVTGADAIRRHTLQIWRIARREVRCLYGVTLPYHDAGSEQRSPRQPGLTFRTIYDRASLEDPDTLTAIEQLVRAGQHARVLPELPMSFCIADSQLALLPQPAGRSPDTAIILYPSALLDALIKLFDALWQRALPLDSHPQRPAAAGRAPAIDHPRLVTLLLSGLTDDALARHLGISQRSIQRHVAGLMNDLGAHTRFQAGARAARRNAGRQSDDHG
jgi:Sugar-specific transcriptional regulator TrmB